MPEDKQAQNKDSYVIPVGGDPENGDREYIVAIDTRNMQGMVRINRTPGEAEVIFVQKKPKNERS